MKLTSRFARSKVVAAAGLLVMVSAFTGSAYSALASGNGSPAPRPGTYSGFDAADTISFKVSADGKMITGLSSTFNPAADCGIPTSGQHERFPALKIRKGHFRGSVAGSGEAEEHFAIQGRFVTPTEATGKVSGSLKVRSLPPCHASQPFTVKRKGKKAAAAAAPPLPKTAKAYSTGGYAHGVSLTLVTSATNPKRIEKGDAAVGSQFAMSGGAIQCPKAKKGEGFHEVPFAVFGFPGATLKMIKGAYGFSKTAKEKTSALGSTGAEFKLKVKIVGRVTNSSSIKGTVKATGGPCTTKTPVSFTAKLNAKLPVAPGQ